MATPHGNTAPNSSQPLPCACKGLLTPTMGLVACHLFDWHVMKCKDWTLDQFAAWIQQTEKCPPRNYEEDSEDDDYDGIHLPPALRPKRTRTHRTTPRPGAAGRHIPFSKLVSDVDRIHAHGIGIDLDASDTRGRC